MLAHAAVDEQTEAAATIVESAPADEALEETEYGDDELPSRSRNSCCSNGLRRMPYSWHDSLGPRDGCSRKAP